MGVLELIIYIAVAGLIVWAITTLVPMPAVFRQAIIVIAVVALVLLLLQSIGWLHGFHDIRIGHK